MLKLLHIHSSAFEKSRSPVLNLMMICYSVWAVSVGRKTVGHQTSIRQTLNRTSFSLVNSYFRKRTQLSSCNIVLLTEVLKRFEELTMTKRIAVPTPRHAGQETGSFTPICYLDDLFPLLHKTGVDKAD